MQIGIIRKIDALGRIVTPKELRRFYQMNDNDYLEIVPTEFGIILKKPGYEVKKIDPAGRKKRNEF